LSNHFNINYIEIKENDSLASSTIPLLTGPGPDRARLPVGRGGAGRRFVKGLGSWSSKCFNPNLLLNATVGFNYLPCVSFFQTEKKAKNFSEVPGGRFRK
jgi:hypothetical protein